MSRVAPRLTQRLGGLLLGLASVACAWGDMRDDPAGRVIDIQLDPASHALQGELRQRLPAGGSFRLLEGLTVTAARRGDDALSLTQDDEGRWQVPPGDDTPVTLRWRGTLPAAGKGDRHWVGADGSLLPTRAGWYPHLRQSPGPLHVTVRVPEGQRAVASGSLLEERQTDDGYVGRYQHPQTRELEIAAGPWQLREREVAGVRLRTLFPEALDAAFAERYLSQTAEHLALFQERLGPLPYASFSIAASPQPVGLAFPGFTLLGERVIPLPFIPRTSLPHELMHAWWGAGVGVDYASGNWSEALTTYLADHALAEQDGAAPALRQRWLTDLGALPAEQERALVAFRGAQDPAGRLIGYQQGALVFHMLRQRIGDAAFTRGLRALAADWMHRTADWSALIDAFSEAAGEPQAPFLDPWLTRPGRPQLQLEAVTTATADDGYRLVVELSQRGAHAPWPLDVPLAVDTEAGPVTFTRPMTQRRQTFELAVASRPLALTVDPEADLLRHPGAMPAILRQLTLDPATRAHVVGEASPSLARRVLGREAETLPASAELATSADAPLLVVGATAAVDAWRRANDLPAPPRALTRAGQARFWMVPGRRIGLLSGDDADALGRLAGTLRHHGQRSYVVQGAGGNTLDAGTWTLEETPLRVTLSP